MNGVKGLLLGVVVGVMALAHADTSEAGVQIPVECKLTRDGANHAIPVVKNRLGRTIPKGSIFRVEVWRTNPMTGEALSLESVKNLPALENILPTKESALGPAGAYATNKACKAKLDTGDPDLIIAKVRWLPRVIGGNNAEAVVKNIAALAPAGASTTRISLMTKQGRSVTVRSVSTPGISAGVQIPVRFNIPKNNCTYLRAQANATGSVTETNTGNNVSYSSEKDQRCTP